MGSEQDSPSVVGSISEAGAGAELKTVRQRIEEMIPLPEAGQYKSHAEYLRGLGWVISFRQTLVRIAENPNLTLEEKNLGFFAEMLEPQVRQAVLTLRRKGYQTINSGFGPKNIQMVEIEDRPNSSPEVRSRLAESGVDVVSRHPGSEFWQFRMEEQDTLESLTEKWNRIAEAVPDTGRRVRPAWVTDRGDVTRGVNLGYVVSEPRPVRRKDRLLDEVEEALYGVEWHIPGYRQMKQKVRSMVRGS